VYILPAKDERNLSYSYLLLIIVSVLVIYILIRANKKAGTTISDTRTVKAM